MIFLQRVLNVAFIYVLCAILIAAFAYQYLLKEDPCFLCYLQRMGMLCVASSLLLNLRFGVKMQHYGLAILAALMGRIVSLRQIGLHICPDFPHFGHPIFGLDLYIWSYIIFTSSIFAVAILLLIEGFVNKEDNHPTFGFWGKLAFGLIFVLAAMNAITTFIDCGLGSCL